MKPDIPIVCQPGALSAEENAERQALLAELRNAAIEERITDRELTWTLEKTQETWLAAARLIAYEWRCCPFLDFELGVIAGEDTIQVTISGPEGTGLMLQHELGM